MSAPYARFFTPPLHGGSFSLPRARDVVKTSVFTRPRKRDSSKVSELRELKAIREENRRLKTLVADLSLDKTILREALRKKW